MMLAANFIATWTSLSPVLLITVASVFLHRRVAAGLTTLTERPSKSSFASSAPSGFAAAFSSASLASPGVASAFSSASLASPDVAAAFSSASLAPPGVAAAFSSAGPVCSGNELFYNSGALRRPAQARPPDAVNMYSSPAPMELGNYTYPPHPGD